MFQLIELSQSTKTSERRAAGATVSRRVDPTFGEAIEEYGFREAVEMLKRAMRDTKRKRG